MTAVSQPPAAGLLRSFERTEASLALAESKLETEQDATFQGANARLNPARLLRRLAALEAELPRLKEAAAKNARARSVLGSLHAAQCSNQAHALALARRAHASVDADAAAFAETEETVKEGLSRLPVPSTEDVAPAPQAEDDDDAPPPPPPPPPPPVAAPGVAASAGPPLTATAALIGELQWLRLGSTVREGVSLDDINEFWSLLRSLFVRRETRSLQAAQLVALGVRLSDENTKKMRILKALGLVDLANNAVALTGDPA